MKNLLDQLFDYLIRRFGYILVLSLMLLLLGSIGILPESVTYIAIALLSPQLYALRRYAKEPDDGGRRVKEDRVVTTTLSALTSGKCASCQTSIPTTTIIAALR
jgi:hypothetical protein